MSREEKAYERNKRLIDAAGPAGTASHSTLASRSYSVAPVGTGQSAIRDAPAKRAVGTPSAVARY